MNANIDMQEHTISNLKSPTSAKDAINKEYLEANFLRTNGGEMKMNYLWVLKGSRI